MRDSSRMTTWCQSTFQALCSWAYCRCSRRWFAARRILYKNTLTRNSRWSRRQRIYEAYITTLVAVDQLDANCLEEVVIHRHAEQVSIVVRWRHLPSSTVSFLSCSVIIGPLLANSHHCGTVPLHTICYCVVKQFSFSKASYSPLFKLRKLLKFLLFPQLGLTKRSPLANNH